MAIVIPENLTKDFNSNIDSKVQTIVSSFGLEGDSAKTKTKHRKPKKFIYILTRQPMQDSKTL
jgi:ABC-2 type transport system permease protein